MKAIIAKICDTRLYTFTIFIHAQKTEKSSRPAYQGAVHLPFFLGMQVNRISKYTRKNVF